jgi:tRNA-dihydrouridine synthase 3
MEGGFGDSGEAPVKAEYRIKVVVKSETPKEEEEEEEDAEASSIPIVAVDACTEEGCEPEVKRSRLHLNNMSTKIALKDEIKLCGSVLKGTTCPFGDGCKFSHDSEAYLAAKPEDLGEECPNVKATGFCKYRLTCRFASKGHVGMEEPNEAVEDPTAGGLNFKLDDVRKKTIKFPLTEAYMASLKDKGTTPIASSAESYPFGERRKIDFSDKLYLAPLTTVGNLPFRRICKEFGVDVTCGEMAMANNLLKGQTTEWALLKRHPSEDLFGVQLCGGWTDSMTQCAELLRDRIDADFIDINMGCPIELVFSKGMGSGLMERTRRVEEIVRGMSTVLGDRMALTVKIRAGVADGKPTAHKLIPQLAGWGAAAVTLHGRSRQQRYTKDADWDYVRSCVDGAAGSIPIIGNGDVMSWEDHERAKAAGVTACMVGRGALIKPWLFTEIKERRHWDISSRERFEMLQRYTRYGLEHFGSDTNGVEKTRRFILEWLSFLHRYVPVGLLERLPQKINHRPPAYFGRDELETLMASHRCEDWMGIAERLLGKAPEGFKFTPKHKSNSYGVTASDRLRATAAANAEPIVASL